MQVDQSGPCAVGLDWSTRGNGVAPRRVQAGEAGLISEVSRKATWERAAVVVAEFGGEDVDLPLVFSLHLYRTRPGSHGQPAGRRGPAPPSAGIDLDR